MYDIYVSNVVISTIGEVDSRSYCLWSICCVIYIASFFILFLFDYNSDH